MEFIKELKQHMVVCICNHTAQEAERLRVQKQHPGVQIKTLFRKMVVVRGALIVAVVIGGRRKMKGGKQIYKHSGMFKG